MVEKGKKVRVSYVGMLEDGTVFDDSSRHGGPLEFTVGNGEVISGFDEAVSQMDVGEEKEVVIPPEKAYGERRSDLVVEIPTEQMVATGKNPHPGMVIKTPSGLYGVVTEVGQLTKVDFNHPLAGRTLKFRIKVEGVVGEGNERGMESDDESSGQDNSDGHGDSGKGNMGENSNAQGGEGNGQQ